MSKSFAVKPWRGITVQGTQVDSGGHVSFTAGPSHQIKEQTVRRTARPPFLAGDAPVTFTIGPVDFPDTAADQKPTGFRFLNNLRGYSGTGTDNVEHYCLDCTFRPWLDATDSLTATVLVTNARGKTNADYVKPDSNGRFHSHVTVRPGDTARITIDDAWGDATAAPVTVLR